MPTSKRERQRAGREARRAAAQAALKRRQRTRRIAALVGLFVLIFVIGFVISQSGDGEEEVATEGSTTTTTEAAEPGTAPCPAADGSSEQKKNFDGPPRQCLEKGKQYTAVLETDIGVIKWKLDREKAPNTVNNFVFLARYHAYDDVPFHRVIPDFVVQGGDVEMGNGRGGPGYQFGDELPEPSDYKEGSIAMANSGPNTNGSQFFIVTSAKGAETLVQAVGGEAKYSLFGEVIEGMDVVKAIEADGAEDGTPKVVHKMIKVTIEESEA